MKTTINGKRYDTARCEILGEHDHHNNGNYCGTTYLLRAADGTLLVWTDSNGQDYMLRDALFEYADVGSGIVTGWTIDDFEMTDDQEARCAELGLVAIV